MLRKTLLASAVATGILFGGVAYAEEFDKASVERTSVKLEHKAAPRLLGGPENGERDRADRIRERIGGVRREDREDFQKHKEQLQEQRELLRKTRKEEMERIRAKKENFIENAKNERDGFRERIKNAETPEEKRQIMEEARKRKDELRREYANKKEEVKKELKSKYKDAFDKRLEIMKKRFDYVFGRMDRIMDRINGAISKLEDRGLDLSAAQAHMVQAQTALDKANDLYDKAVLGILDMNIDSIDTLRQEAKNIKNEYKAVVEALKESRKHMRLAVASIKEVINKNRASRKPTTPGSDVGRSDNQ